MHWALFVHSSYLPDDISGMIEPTGTGTHKITVNQEHPFTRQRFTIAHELGHFLLHERLIGSGIDDDRAYRSSSAGRYYNTDIGPKEETGANKIAATILMPIELVNARRAEGIVGVGQLAEEFGVSKHAMSIRLKVIHTP